MCESVGIKRERNNFFFFFYRNDNTNAHTVASQNRGDYNVVWLTSHYTMLENDLIISIYLWTFQLDTSLLYNGNLGIIVFDLLHIYIYHGCKNFVGVFIISITTSSGTYGFGN